MTQIIHQSTSVPRVCACVSVCDWFVFGSRDLIQYRGEAPLTHITSSHTVDTSGTAQLIQRHCRNLSPSYIRNPYVIHTAPSASYIRNTNGLGEALHTLMHGRHVTTSRCPHCEEGCWTRHRGHLPRCLLVILPYPSYSRDEIV